MELPTPSLLALASSADDSLTLIILLDQISRNVNRGPDMAWLYNTCDPVTRHILHHCLRVGYDMEHPPHKRFWYYLVLMHSEAIADQELGLSKMSTLVCDVRSGEWRAFLPPMKQTLDITIKYYKTIDQFGRFPHRNASLNRETTEEEEKFLLAGGSHG